MVEAISLGLDPGGLGADAEYRGHVSSPAKAETGIDGSYNPFPILKCCGFNILTTSLIMHQYLIHIVKSTLL